MTLTLRRLAGAAALLTMAAPGAALAQTELRFTCYGDGNECEVMRELLDRFEAAEPGHQGRPRQGAVQGDHREPAGAARGRRGAGPRARHRPRRPRTYYLDLRPTVDAAYWEENFGADARRGTAPAAGRQGHLRHDDPAHRHRPLRQQDAVRAGRRRDARPTRPTWDDWAEAAREVAEATETPFPMAIDRSGHRFAGPAIAHGRQDLRRRGRAAVVDDGFKRDGRSKFVDWHKNGTMAKEVWGGSGGSAYRDASEEFINGQRRLLLLRLLADRAVRQDDRRRLRLGGRCRAPCGPAGCTGMPGGAGARRLQAHQAPGGGRQGDRLLRARADVHAELIARTENVPAHTGCRQEGPRLSGRLAAGRGGAARSWRRQVAEDLAGRLQAPGLSRSTARSSTPIGQRVDPGDRRRDDASTRRCSGSTPTSTRRSPSARSRRRAGAAGPMRPAASAPEPALEERCSRRSPLAARALLDAARGADAAAQRLLGEQRMPGCSSRRTSSSSACSCSCRSSSTSSTRSPAASQLLLARAALSSAPRTSRRCSTAGTISTRRTCEQDLFWRGVFNTALLRRCCRSAAWCCSRCSPRSCSTARSAAAASSAASTSFRCCCRRWSSR